MANSNGNYKIVIGVTKDGLTLVGASSVNHYSEQKKIDDREWVYGIQIGHRCAAKTESGWEIMTPTQAKKPDTTKREIFLANLGRYTLTQKG